jgi:hypothetical protein
MLDGLFLGSANGLQFCRVGHLEVEETFLDINAKKGCNGIGWYLMLPPTLSLFTNFASTGIVLDSDNSATHTFPHTFPIYELCLNWYHIGL